MAAGSSSAAKSSSSLTARVGDAIDARARALESASTTDFSDASDNLGAAAGSESSSSPVSACFANASDARGRPAERSSK